MDKYSVEGISFEAKTNWEATNKAIKIMSEKGISKGKVISHHERGDSTVTNIIFPK